MKKYISKTVKASDISVNSNVPRDNYFIELYKKALKGDILCQIALIKIEGIKPFTGYEPKISEDYRSYFETQEKEGKPPMLHVYFKDDAFVMSDDYNAYFMYVEKGYKEVGCIVLGEVTGTYVLEKGKLFKLEASNQEPIYVIKKDRGDDTGVKNTDDNSLFSTSSLTTFKTHKVVPEGIYRKENNKLILGKALTAYIHNGQYHLTQIKVYEDGLIDCWELVSFEEFKKKVRQGWVVTEVPNIADINASLLGSFTATNVVNYVKPEEFIKEVKDVIDELNGKPTTSELCREAYEEYKKDPTEANKIKLKSAYEAVPQHNRIYILGDQDHKDSAIQSILYQ